MRNARIRFPDIAADIARINAQREALVLGAFEALEHRYPALAQVLLESVGSRQRAAHWMCTHQRALEGRTAYELLGEGDEDSVWDLLSKAGRIGIEGSSAELRITL